MADGTPAKASSGRIALLAGGGMVPEQVAQTLESSGYSPFIVLLGGVEPQWATRFEHIRIGWGEVGRLIKSLNQAGCRRVCLAGSVVRPDVTSIKFDLGGLFALPRVLKAGFGGDDKILRHVVSLFEEKGFEVVAITTVAPEMAVPRGLAEGGEYPGREADLAIGIAAFKQLAPLDIGQALVVIREQIVAVEGAEGTDGLLARVAEMREKGRIKAKPGEGLLLKAAKPGQDLRVDLPTIGTQTLLGAKAAGLGGIAVEAERVISPDLAAVQRLAAVEGLHLASFVLENA